MTAHGTVHWIELNTRNADAAMKFYGETMGWTFDAVPMDDGVPYYLCIADGEIAAGIFTMTGPTFDSVPEHWFTYFAVDDVDARIAKAKALGGRIVREPFDVPGIGRIAIVGAPTGSVSGWMTAAGDDSEAEYGVRD